MGYDKRERRHTLQAWDECVWQMLFGMICGVPALPLVTRLHSPPNSLPTQVSTGIGLSFRDLAFTPGLVSTYVEGKTLPLATSVPLRQFAKLQ